MRVSLCAFLLDEPGAALSSTGPLASGSSNDTSGLYHTACTLTVYASQPGVFPPDHARLASGWGSAFSGWGGAELAPTGTQNEASSAHDILLIQAFPGALQRLVGRSLPL